MKSTRLKAGVLTLHIEITYYFIYIYLFRKIPKSLNYENNILFYDPALTAELRQRQNSYIAQSRLITREEVAGWSGQRRLGNNAIAILGPVL